MEIPSDYVYAVQAAMEQWTDERVIPADDLEDLLLFIVYVPKALSQFGMTLRGHVIRQKEGMNLLTVKATEGSTPLVAFVTSATPMGCVSRFVTLLESDRVSWTRDKYPWN